MSKHISLLVLSPFLLLLLSFLSPPASAAVQTIEIILDESGKGEIRGSEICTPDEYEKLKAMLDAGIPTLADCFLDADRVRSVLQAYNLTVREVNTFILPDQHRLTWTASFSKLPSNFGPLHNIVPPVITESEPGAFYAQLGQPDSRRTTVSDPLLANLSVVIRLQVPGTILSADRPRKTLANRPALSSSSSHPRILPGVIEHSGEAVRWTIDGASLQANAYDLTASIASGRAAEASYFLFLMVVLTLLVLAVAFGILYRGLKKPATPID